MSNFAEDAGAVVTATAPDFDSAEQTANRDTDDNTSAATPPTALRELPAWLVWRFEPNPHKPEGKPLKVPYYANGLIRSGEQGTQRDRDRLVTFDAAHKALEASEIYDGVGFCPLQGFGIVALDFDRCVDVDGTVDGTVENLVAGTYAEYSPSGTGVRAFLRCDDGEALGNRKDHGEPFGFEVFETKGFVTFTGNVLPSCVRIGADAAVSEITQTIRDYCDDRFGPTVPAGAGDGAAREPVGLSDEQLADAVAALPNDGANIPYEASKGPSWLAVGMALHHETGGSEDGFALWDDWSQQSAKYGGTEYGRQKWDSFGKGGQRPYTANSLIRWANAAGGDIVHPDSVATADDFDDLSNLVPATPQSEKPRRRFTIVRAADFASGPDPEYLVDGWIQEREIALVYGASGTGKSFLVQDMACAVQRGVPWRGTHRTKQATVLWIAAEAGAGMRKRLRAYAAHNGVDLDDVGMGVIADAPNLTEKGDITALLEAAEAFGDVGLIVVDTLSQSIPGTDENSQKDMTTAMANCNRLRDSCGAAVILIHHTGKNSDQSRGSSVITNNAVTRIHVENAKQEATRFKSATLRHQKDGEAGASFPFELAVCEVGRNRDGEAVTSCAVQHEIDPAEFPPPEQPRLGRVEMRVYDQHGGLDLTGQGVTWRDLRRALNEAHPDPKGDHKRALRGLVEKGVLRWAGGEMDLVTDPHGGMPASPGATPHSRTTRTPRTNPHAGCEG